MGTYVGNPGHKILERMYPGPDYGFREYELIIPVNFDKQIGRDANEYKAPKIKRGTLLLNG